MASGAECDPGGLLTVEEYRQHDPRRQITDAALCQQLKGAYDAIVTRYGAAQVLDYVVMRYGGRRITVIELPRPAETITSIVEYPTAYPSNGVTLAADDWLLSPSGLYLTRLRTGTHPRYDWHRIVVVTYDTRDDTGQYIAAQVALVKAALTYTGRTARGTPQESETISGYADEREAILSTIARPRPLF